MGHEPVPGSRRLVLSLRSPLSLLMGRPSCPASWPHPQCVPLLPWYSTTRPGRVLHPRSLTAPPRRLRVCQSVCIRLLKQLSARLHQPPLAAAPVARHPAPVRSVPGGAGGGWEARAGGKRALYFLYSKRFTDKQLQTTSTNVDENLERLPD